MVLIVVCLLIVAAGAPGPVRVTALATAAGVAFGSSAALVKLTTAELSGPGVAATARDWPGYSLAVATGVGLVVQQLAFAAGRLAAATTAMIVANPIVGYAIAVFGFGEHFPSGVGRLSGIAVGGACAVVGRADAGPLPGALRTGRDRAHEPDGQHSGDGLTWSPTPPERRRAAAPAPASRSPGPWC